MDVEVIVLGGGAAGGAAALRLAQRGLSVVLIEQQAATPFKIGEGLPPAVNHLLRQTGLGEAFHAADHLPSYGNQSAWGTPFLTYIDFINDPHGHGWHLDRIRFEESLLQAACNIGAQIQRGMRVSTIQQTGDEWRVRVGEARISGQWIIDCSGRNRILARRLHIPSQVNDRLVALYRLYTPQTGHQDEDGSTMIEAESEGWWYTARLPSCERIVSFFTDSDLKAARTRQTVAAFDDALARMPHLTARLQGYQPQNAPQTLVASSSRLARFAGDGWLAAGDCACTFDPLSSQGILNALYTGTAAADAIVSGDIADYEALIEEMYQVYLENRRIYYLSESRWSKSPFWQRRHGAYDVR